MRFHLKEEKKMKKNNFVVHTHEKWTREFVMLWIIWNFQRISKIIFIYHFRFTFFFVVESESCQSFYVLLRMTNYRNTSTQMHRNTIERIERKYKVELIKQIEWSDAWWESTKENERTKKICHISYWAQIFGKKHTQTHMHAAAARMLSFVVSFYDASAAMDTLRLICESICIGV